MKSLPLIVLWQIMPHTATKACGKSLVLILYLYDVKFYLPKIFYNLLSVSVISFNILGIQIMMHLESTAKLHIFIHTRNSKLIIYDKKSSTCQILYFYNCC